MQIKGYQNGGFTPEEPVPTGVHNNIDNLIAESDIINKINPEIIKKKPMYKIKL